MMTAKRTYTDGFLPTMLVIYLLVCLMMTGIWVGAGGAALSLGVSVAAVGAILLPLLLIMMLVYSFVSVRRVTCDSVGCLVASGSAWRTEEPLRFNWSDVRSTKVAPIAIGAGRYRTEYLGFLVRVKNQQVELLREHRFRKEFANLVANVNQMTPQLPYVWVKGKDLDGRNPMETVASYHKVERV